MSNVNSNEAMIGVRVNDDGEKDLPPLSCYPLPATILSVARREYARCSPEALLLVARDGFWGCA